jgi:hypothetical protein
VNNPKQTKHILVKRSFLSFIDYIGFSGSRKSDSHHTCDTYNHWCIIFESLHSVLSFSVEDDIKKRDVERIVYTGGGIGDLMYVRQIPQR